MITLTHNDKKAYVVGHFFSLDGDVGGRLSCAFAGNEIAKDLEHAFQTNTQENYDELAHHPDPNVRLLVARNFEQLDVLAEDNNDTVREAAQFVQSIVLPVKVHHESH